MKPYRSKDPNDERKWKKVYALDDVDEVGNQKAIGYVCARVKGERDPLDGAWSIAYLRVMGKLFKEKGKLTHIRPADDSVGCQSLWVGDPTMMQKILDRHTKLLEKNKCPIDAKSFFSWICNTDIDHQENPDMYHMICELFNSWCLWCKNWK